MFKKEDINLELRIILMRHIIIWPIIMLFHVTPHFYYLIIGGVVAFIFLANVEKSQS